MNELQQRSKVESEKMSLEREKLKVARENQANDLAIAKLNAKNRGSKKTKK